MGPTGCGETPKFNCKNWDPARPLVESPGPFGPGIPKESPEESPGAFRPRAQKVKCPKQSRKSLRGETPKFNCKNVPLLSQGEKPPKIRKKSSQEQSSWERFFFLLPLKRQRK